MSLPAYRQADWPLHGNEQPTAPIFKRVFRSQTQLRNQVYHLTQVLWKALQEQTLIIELVNNNGNGIRLVIAVNE